MKRIIYISLPISGRDIERQRRLATLWERFFVGMDYDVVNPFTVYDQLKTFLGREPTYEEIMQVDLSELRSCTDILLVEDWFNSKGCMDEVDTAAAKGIKIHYDVKVKLG